LHQKGLETTAQQLFGDFMKQRVQHVVLLLSELLNQQQLNHNAKEKKQATHHLQGQFVMD